MRVALLSGYPNGAIDQVMQVLAKGARKEGVDVDIVTMYPKPEAPWGEYDVVHAGYYPYLGKVPHSQIRAMTANVWHIALDLNNLRSIIICLSELDYKFLIADDVMTLQQLGQLDHTNVVLIPMPIDQDKWRVLPPPVEPFTVGVFCNDYFYKRWQVIVNACEHAGVNCLPVITKENRKTYDLDPLNDVYAKVHVLASATFVDTNSLPLREALLCGRPVISTRNDGLARVLQHGHNGRWFNGSVDDLAKQIRTIQADYATYRANAIATKFESLSDIVAAYIKVWKDAANV